MIHLYLGQKLRCLNGETVVIKQILNNKIIVEYKKRLFERPLSIIGTKLFVLDCDKEKFENRRDKENSKHCSDDLSLKAEIKYSCNDCRINRRGDCFGKKEICEDFQPCTKFSKEKMKNWPKEMQGAYD